MSVAGVLSASLLHQFSMFVGMHLGLHYPPQRWAELERGLATMAADFGFPGPESCIRRLMSTPPQRQQVEALASYLTVGETYFFRDPAVFTALEQHVLPALISAGREQGRRLRLWSAGCCTGEEAYSLAIVLERLIPDLDDWYITLLATDINPQFLARARLGSYRDWSFRSAPGWLKPRYFAPGDGGVHTLVPRIRHMVSFDYLNLVDDAYPAPASNTGGMDLILCRNVLMYFADDMVRAIVAKLQRCLGAGGWLVVSPSEGGAALQSGLAAVEFTDTMLYRKLDPAWRSPPAVPEEEATSAAPTALRPRSEAMSGPGTPAGNSLAAQARACYSRGDYVQAIALLATAAPADAQDLALAARACANLGRLDEAQGWCARAVDADRSAPDLRYLQAVILAERGNVAAAIGGFRQTLYLDPDFVLAHFALGHLHQRIGQTTRAGQHFANTRRLLADTPADAALPQAEGLTAGRLLAILDSTEQIP